MKVITWNIRWMNNIHKLDIVQNFVTEHKIDILVLQETKMKKDKAEKLKSFNNYCIMVSSFEGVSRGTTILCKNYLFSGTFLDANKHLMVVKLKNYTYNNYWYIVNVYAPSNKKARKKFWDSLSKIKSVDYYGRWLFFGDFNVPLYEHEKKCGNSSNWKEYQI